MWDESGIFAKLCYRPSYTISVGKGDKILYSGDYLYLSNFIRNYSMNNYFQALQMDLSAILKNQSSLFAFMQFLKEENALNQLQFCLSVGKLG